MTLKRLTFALVCFFGPLSLVLAQNEEPPPSGGLEDVDWMKYAALILNAVLVPLAADVLKPLWGKAPMFLKTLMPLVIGSVIALAESWLLGKLGFAVDLGLILAVFTGGGAAASLAFKQGKKQA